MSAQPKPEQLEALYRIPGTIWSKDLRCTLNGVEYEWSGGFGAILKSRERGVKVGDLRMIGEVPFYAYRVDSAGDSWFWEKPEIMWTIPNDFLTPEWIRAFKAALFSIES